MALLLRLFSKIASTKSIYISIICIFLLALNLFFSLEHGLTSGSSKQIPYRVAGTFIPAVCSIYTIKIESGGRYVCSLTGASKLQEFGLTLNDYLLNQRGSSLKNLVSNGSLINHSLDLLFSGPTKTLSGPITPIGWGMDAGYTDFVQLAFNLFGYTVESLFYFFYTLLCLSFVLILWQFYKNLFVVFIALTLSYIFYIQIQYLAWWDLGGINNPKLLSFLAIVPLIHFLCLFLYQVNISLKSFLLFLPQALLIILACDFRANAYWSLITIGLTFFIFIGYLLLTRNKNFKLYLLKVWPCVITFFLVICLNFFIFYTVDSRLEKIGGMRAHSFWQPLYYNLQFHPEWKNKYSVLHNDATGDNAPWEAVKTFREKNHLNDDLTQISYENLMRKVYWEFVKKDPWYVVELKYYNFLNFVYFTKASISLVWSTLRWSYILLFFVCLFGVINQILKKVESMFNIMAGAIGSVVIFMLSATPPLMLVLVYDSAFDSMSLSILASFLIIFAILVIISIKTINFLNAFIKLKFS